MSGTKTLWLSRDVNSKVCKVWERKPIETDDGLFVAHRNSDDHGTYSCLWLAEMVQPWFGECVELTINVTWGEEGAHVAEQSDR